MFMDTKVKFFEQEKMEVLEDQLNDWLVMEYTIENIKDDRLFSNGIWVRLMSNRNSLTEKILNGLTFEWSLNRPSYPITVVR